MLSCSIATNWIMILYLHFNILSITIIYYLLVLMGFWVFADSYSLTCVTSLSNFVELCQKWLTSSNQVMKLSYSFHKRSMPLHLNFLNLLLQEVSLFDARVSTSITALTKTFLLEYSSINLCLVDEIDSILFRCS